MEPLCVVDGVVDAIDAGELIGAGGEQAERDRHEQRQPRRRVRGAQLLGEIIGAEHEAGKPGMRGGNLGGVEHPRRCFHHRPERHDPGRTGCFHSFRRVGQISVVADLGKQDRVGLHGSCRGRRRRYPNRYPGH